MKVLRTRGDGLDNLTIDEIPEPHPGSGEVLVKIHAVSLNYRDLLVINGVGGWKPAPPRIPGSDGVGVVAAVGTNVSRVKVGDRVAGIFLPEWLDGELTAEKYVSPLGGAAADGVLAEFVIFAEDSIVKIPANLSDVEAAALPVAAVTAWHAVYRRSQVKPGESVLIEGTGGVSLFALQFVAALGGSAIVTSSSDEKLEKARKLGAAATINYKKTPDWAAEVLTLTRGKGVDHVIEVVGGDNLNQSLKSVKLSGSISFIGLMAGLSAPINTYEFVTKNIRLHGIETGSREMFEEMSRFIELHRIRPVIDRVFPFDETREALKYLESGSHFGKVVVRISEQ
jgi:NADPH:quinone reductase-like Zn-dependent oxidoreductase